MTDFLEKWSSKKADKPKAGTKTVIDTFRSRVAEQKAYLEEYERDAAGFKKWRSTWFQRVPGGFGVSIGRDSVNAGKGLSYVVVETLKDVAEFLDDLAHHAENDAGFQQALEENRKRRATLLNAAKTAGKGIAPKTAVAKASRAKSPATAESDAKPKRGRKPKAENIA
ncbi:hypothetical protein [Rhizobium sp. P44RR-XXIV]|uniref:hypothetical protein n=1 Tax=Rhizobium sp. P44RR-XXIV TaxID=1921145 RepID=UPI00098486DD|nr:hypothetical protein [Rhizobium sp. P44RR-XXIV]TIX90165.1 hypothetical protein BSK43_012685 [Rhizobium sp. P44RR-XXIV]